jgi:pantoate--beta-alanine ligase
MITQLDRVEEMRIYARRCRQKGLKLGLVPTMGYLHEGHLSLIEIARACCDVVVVSIFVNPTQFGVDEDLDRYPRDLPGDLNKITQAGAQAVFLPSVEEIYDGGASVEVSIPALARRLCGVSRPHHFDGVCQVVLKLLNLVKCDVAVFGEKDFQQLAIIRRLVKDLYLDIEVLGGPIIRTTSGLAMSSRNVYLNDAERAQSDVLFRTLNHAQMRVESGVTDASILKGEMVDLIQAESEARCDYVEIVDPESLLPLGSLDPARGARALVAVKFGETRLIDNAALGTAAT